MSRVLQIAFKSLLITLILISSSDAELIKPSRDIKPDKVIEIQLNGLKKMI